MKKFVAGFLSGALLFGIGGAFAVNSIYDNPYKIFVNGEEKQIQGYNVDDYSYFKLRDIADAVGGFTVDFKDDTIQLYKDGYVPKEAPQIEMKALNSGTWNITLKYPVHIVSDISAWNDDDFSLICKEEGSILIERLAQGSEKPKGSSWSDKVVISNVDSYVEYLFDRESIAGQSGEGAIKSKNISDTSIGEFQGKKVSYEKYDYDFEISETAITDEYKVDYYIFQNNDSIYVLKFTYNTGDAFVEQCIRPIIDSVTDATSSNLGIVIQNKKPPVYAPDANTYATQAGWIASTMLYEYDVKFDSMVNGHYGNPKFVSTKNQNTSLSGIQSDRDTIYALTDSPSDFEMELEKEYTFNGIRMKRTGTNLYAYEFSIDDLKSNGIIK